MTAKLLLRIFRGLLDTNSGIKSTSTIMYDPNKLEKKVSFIAIEKDENGIFKSFQITVEETIPPVDPERYDKKSEIYKDIFENEK
jgi:hypothetical protein